MSAQERAEVLRTAEGCALCLDWTRDHLKEFCPYSEQFKVCNISCYGMMHNHLLYETDVKCVNTMAPSSGDAKNPKRLRQLPQAQALQAHAQDG